MTKYRRADCPGGYYFFTVVAYKRRPILVGPLARDCLREAITEVRQKQDFEVVAWCLLPDHLHCIWKLPVGDKDFSGRWAGIKSRFTRKYLAGGGVELEQTASRRNRRERGVWQRRFWEHQIRDEDDLQVHINYIHYNPVKHELVTKVEDWPFSTYHRYVKGGRYQDEDWGLIIQGFDGISANE